MNSCSTGAVNATGLRESIWHADVHNRSSYRRIDAVTVLNLAVPALAAYELICGCYLSAGAALEALIAW